MNFDLEQTLDFVKKRNSEQLTRGIVPHKKHYIKKTEVFLVPIALKILSKLVCSLMSHLSNKTNLAFSDLLLKS